MLEEQNSVNGMLLSEAEQMVSIIIGLRRAGYVGGFKLFIWQCLPLQFNFTELQIMYNMDIWISHLSSMFKFNI